MQGFNGVASAGIWARERAELARWIRSEAAERGGLREARAVVLEMAVESLEWGFDAFGACPSVPWLVGCDVIARELPGLWDEARRCAAEEVAS